MELDLNINGGGGHVDSAGDSPKDREAQHERYRQIFKEHSVNIINEHS